jgi:uncharacterized membrane protein
LHNALPGEKKTACLSTVLKSTILSEYHAVAREKNEVWNAMKKQFQVNLVGVFHELGMT